MKVAFIIYNDITALDFVGVYDPISRLKSMGFIDDLEIDICSYSEEVVDYSGMIHFSSVKVKESLSEYDMIIIPGGFGTRKLMKNSDFLKWIQSSKTEAVKASVCTGALILGAGGYLAERHATTHFNSFDVLETMGAIVEREQRVVADGNVITARGVSAGIDLGLYICQMLKGKEVREKIAKQMDYNRE